MNVYFIMMFDDKKLFCPIEFISFCYVMYLIDYELIVNIVLNCFQYSTLGRKWTLIRCQT
jgi:hypothetical protein